MYEERKINICLALRFSTVEETSWLNNVGGSILTIVGILVALWAFGSIAGGPATTAKAVLDVEWNKQKLEVRNRQNEVIQSSILTWSKLMKYEKLRIKKHVTFVVTKGITNYHIEDIAQDLSINNCRGVFM